MDDATLKSLTRSLKRHAHAIGLPEGAAETFIEKSLADVTKKLQNKTIITEEDLTRAIVKELKKYNPDFAYVYQNRDKII